jgi:glutathione S-transferase
MSYKRVPFDESIENMKTRFEVLQARTGKTMVPVIISPADEALNDSTVIAAFLEKHHPAAATRWSNPAIDALAMLLEDYADEWIVRIMLTSRWYHDADAAQNAALIAAGMSHGVWGLDLQRAAKEFPPGIVSTVPRMGATRQNAQGWYDMVPRILTAMGKALESASYLTGTSAHLCDFAFYGQLNQIRRDPTGHGWIEAAPESVIAWLDRLEGACKEGVDTAGEPVTDVAPLAELVSEAAQTYLRMSVANAIAVERGVEAPVQVALRDGFAFEAPPAKYNRKILAANLDTLETLYASGAKLPGACEEIVMAELRPLAAAGSALLTERPSLRAQL